MLTVLGTLPPADNWKIIKKDSSDRVTVLLSNIRRIVI